MHIVVLYPGKENLVYNRKREKFRELLPELHLNDS